MHFRTAEFGGAFPRKTGNLEAAKVFFCRFLGAHLARTKLLEQITLKRYHLLDAKRGVRLQREPKRKWEEAEYSIS